MSKTKGKSRSEIEHFRGENKRLKSENRQLRKRLAQLTKEAHFYEYIVEEETEEVRVKGNGCPECNTGVLVDLDLTHVVITKCDNEHCGYKKSRKPRKKS